MCNDSGVITERNPDSVRGADVAFYSYKRLPKGALARGYGPEVPELGCRGAVTERSLARHSRENHGVSQCRGDHGCRADPGPDTAHVFSADDAPKMLATEDELVLPGIWTSSGPCGEFFD